MLSIHNNLSADSQNVTGAYVTIMLVYRCLFTGACLQVLVNNTLTWQSSCVIANIALKTTVTAVIFTVLIFHESPT